MCVSVVSDSISSVVSLAGYTQIVVGNSDFYSGEAMCQMTLLFLFSSFGISMMNLCLIGLDRYFFIVKPLSLFYRRNKQFILVAGECVIWSTSILINMPILFYVSVHQIATLLCDIPIITPSISVYLSMHATILFILPNIIKIITYARIITFQKSYRRPGEFVKNQRHEEQMKNKKFIRTLILISSSYIIVTWPFSATLIGMVITRQSVMVTHQKNIVHLFLIFFLLR